MPLLGKEEFYLKTLPPGLSQDAEIFYYNTTGEAFLSYEEFYDRQVLCTSDLWTCSVTGKSGLTYTEALNCEKESRMMLASIPRVLRKVLLHLMTYLDNFSTNVVISLLFEFANLRYFIGEHVQIVSKNKSKRVNGIIRDVIAPEVYDESNSVAYGIDPMKYQYVVDIVEETSSGRVNSTETLVASRISRAKTILTRDKIRLFLRTHLSPKNSRYERLSIKEESLKKFGIENLKWEDIFKGPIPNFKDDTMLVKAFNNKDRQRLSDVFEAVQNNDSTEEVVSLDDVQIMTKKSNLLAAQKSKLSKREEKNKVHESNEKKKKSDKLKLKGDKKNKQKNQAKSAELEETVPRVPTIEDKNQEKEAKRRFEEDLRNWMEKRDDLLCDDLKPLPPATQVNCCQIDNYLVGDCLFIIDFLNTFYDYIEFAGEFPPNFSIDFFSQLLVDRNPEEDSGIGALFISLLRTILKSTNRDDADSQLRIKETDEDYDACLQNVDENELSNFPNDFSNHWVSTYFYSREKLSKFKLDQFNVSEILRIYILKTRNEDSKGRARISDDDLLLAKKLITQTIYDFDMSQRVAVFKLLLNDLVKIPLIRCQIESSMEDMFRKKTEIRHLNAAFTKWLRENPIRLRVRKKKQEQNGEQNDNAPDEAEPTEAEKEQYKMEKNQREQQMKKSIALLKAEIRQLSSYCRLRPIGQDRSYRKYWIFQSIPGLFVEHPPEDELNLPCLDSPKPILKPKLNQYLPNAKRRKRKSQSSENSKETTDVVCHSKDGTLFERCTGDHSTCSVHGLSNTQFRVRWSFYSKEQLDSLIESLNSRGFRENELKNALNIEKESILKNLQQFIPQSFNPDYVTPIVEVDLENIPRKSERIQKVEKKKSEKKVLKLEPAEADPWHAHLNAFKLQLLDVEDNVFNCCLSSFSFKGRDEWYKGLLDNQAMPEGLDALKMMTEKFKTLALALRPFCLMPPLSVYHDSSSASPSDKENIENSQAKKQMRLPTLSEKWLDTLRVPEGIFADEACDFDSTYGITSLSQLFVNLYILEKAINWDMSANKTASKCNICNRKANDQMLLCDLCNRGYHLTCVDPKAKSASDLDDDWFCDLCVPNRPRNSLPNKKIGKDEKPEAQSQKSSVTTNGYKVETRTRNEEHSEGTSSEMNGVDEFVMRCPLCKKHVLDEYGEVVCKTCNKSFHLKCVKLVRVPRSWNCSRCQAQESSDENHHSDSNDVRRSSRKRKPNAYYDYDSVEDGQTYNIKTRRHDIDDAEPSTKSRRLNHLNHVEVSL